MGANCNDKYHLSMFQFKTKEFVTSEKLTRKFGYNYIPPCFQLTYEADRKAAKLGIIERQFYKKIKIYKTRQLKWQKFFKLNY